MAAQRAAKKTTAKKTTAKKSAGRFTDDERSAMKDRAAELKAERQERTRADGEQDVRTKIAEMPDDDRVLAERIHEIVTATAPDLVPRTWYGMPAYAKDGDVLCFFQSAAKFKARYAMLGFSDKANLDKGSMWPVYFALTTMTGTAEKDIRALVKQAIS